MDGTFRTRFGGLVMAATLAVAFAPAPGSARTTEGEGVRRIVLEIPPTVEASEVKPRATFRAETEGSPQPTIVGGWSDSANASNQAQLQFAGGHAVLERTSFLGDWVSPATTSSKEPTMTIAYTIAAGNLVGSKIPIFHSVRARFDRGKWGPWVEAKTHILPSDTGSRSGSVEVVVPLTEPRRVQFQWKIAGVIRGPAAIVADFQVDAS